MTVSLVCIIVISFDSCVHAVCHLKAQSSKVLQLRAPQPAAMSWGDTSAQGDLEWIVLTADIYPGEQGEYCWNLFVFGAGERH